MQPWQHVRGLYASVRASASRQGERAGALWRRLRGGGPAEQSDAPDSPPDPRGEAHLEAVAASLRSLLDDDRIPQRVRQALDSDYAAIERLVEKLEQGQVFIAAFGRVSVGKSSLLNALLGEPAFSTSVLHGETRVENHANWEALDTGGAVLIDTPGLDEVGGEGREALAKEVAARADIVMFVVEGDLTATEAEALAAVHEAHRPLLLVLNKADRYTPAERERLLERLRERTAGRVPPEWIVPVSAAPAPQTVIAVDDEGTERELRRPRPPEVAPLRMTLADLLEREGKTLAAVNAGLFAGRLADSVSERIVALRKQLARELIERYAVGKGLGMAFNPVPLLDLFALGADVHMVMALGRLYGMPVSRVEADRLLRAIAAQIAATAALVTGIHVGSSLLKGASLGLSTLITASAQGAVGYASSVVVGRAAEQFFAQGKSWGEGGPKRVVHDILSEVDQDSLLNEGRDAIEARLRRARGAFSR